MKQDTKILQISIPPIRAGLGTPAQCNRYAVLAGALLSGCYHWHLPGGRLERVDPAKMTPGAVPQIHSFELRVDTLDNCATLALLEFIAEAISKRDKTAIGQTHELFLWESGPPPSYLLRSKLIIQIVATDVVLGLHLSVFNTTVFTPKAT